MYGTDKVALLCEAQSGEERGRASSANETTAKARNAQRKTIRCNLPDVATYFSSKQQSVDLHQTVSAQNDKMSYPRFILLLSHTTN